ncbi:MAG TPA: GNAT family N-acetyltransferase, partial [Nitrospirota bacterium]|nr:GNAT family N-acetyltransferase [Nitrospirota bacterium]
SITDKSVVIRHATETDRVRVEEYFKRHGNATDLGTADLVVAAEEQRIIGFGILKKENDAGCVSVFEDSRRKGIGSTIVKHLMKYEPLKRVYATRNVSFFTRYGFARETGRPRARATRSSGRECRMPLMERLSAAAYQKL